jgi:Arc/MetJ-type ribon-helix-helix transcriptional regulator
MISFRLTDEEYERFRRLCVARGLRNVSELVRTAVNQMLVTLEDESRKPHSEMEFRVNRLESQVADLIMALGKMERRIGGDTFTLAAGG